MVLYGCESLGPGIFYIELISYVVVNRRGNMNVCVLEGRERWDKFPKVLSSSNVIDFGNFYFLTPPSVSPTKGYSFLWMQKCRQDRPRQNLLPRGMEGLYFPRRTHTEPWHLQRCPLHLPEISHCYILNGAWNSGWTRRKEVALPPSHTSANELWVGCGTVGRRQI